MVYGAVHAGCSPATVRFVAGPAGRRGSRRPITTRFTRVSGAYGSQVVCAIVRGLRPGRTYALRIAERRGVFAGPRTLRAVPTGRRALPQEGCA